MAVDKAQKQLVDTYFRKRIIAEPHGYDYRLKSYEKIYMLKTGIVEFDKIRNSLNGDDISAIITDMPELRTKIGVREMSKMNDNNKANIFIKRPELADDVNGFQTLLYFVSKGEPVVYTALNLKILKKQPKFTRTEYFKKAFEQKLYRFDPEIVAELLIKQPALADEKNFIPLLSKLTPEYIVAVLAKQPQLADKFDLKKLGAKDAVEMLVAQPQLANRLNLSKMNKNDLEDLLMINPKLAPILNKIRRNG